MILIKPDVQAESIIYYLMIEIVASIFQLILKKFSQDNQTVIIFICADFKGLYDRNTNLRTHANTFI